MQYNEIKMWEETIATSYLMIGSVEKGFDVVKQRALSLGSARDFWILENEHLTKKGKEKTNFRFNVRLENGSLFTMDDHASNFGGKHCLPKRKKVKGGRIVLGFRE